MGVFQKAVLRIPLLPASLLPDIEQAILTHRPLCEPVLSSFMEAVYISSPEFFDVLSKELSSNDGILRDERIKVSALKYLNRMCQRATPYGTMAYMSLVKLGDTTTPIDPQSATLERGIRLDSLIAIYLLEHISKLPFFYSAIPFYPNNSISIASDKIRYIETTVVNNYKKYKIASINPDLLIKSLLKFARGGKNRKELFDFILAKYPNFDSEDVSAYVEDLIENNILLSGMSLNVTDTDVLEKIYDCILTHENESSEEYLTLKTRIQQLSTLMNHARTCTSKESVDTYISIKALVKEIIEDIEEKKPVFQVDSFKNIPATINKRIAAKLQSVITSLAKVKPLYESPELEAFIKEFSLRYEGKPVKLLQALDPDIGIGYPSNKSIQNEANDALASMLGSANTLTSKKLSYIVDGWYRFLIDKYVDCQKENSNEIHISLSDMKRFETKQSINLPPTFSLLCKLKTDSCSALDAGSYLLYPFDVHAPSAANVYARFTHLNSEVTDFVQEIIDKEDTCFPNCINVEIEHIGQPRTANVSLRVVNRPYKINVTCTPNSKEVDSYLNLDDLYLIYAQGELILYSKTLKKRIIPFMTSAYNYQIDELPIINFMGALQNRGYQNSLLWDWGVLREFNFLPRVIVDKNILLSPAFWRIKKNSLDTTSFEGFKKSICAFFKENTIPDRVLYGRSDNLLLIDVTIDAYLQIIYKDICQEESVIFIEDFMNGEYQIINDGKQNYYNEILLSYHTDTIRTNEQNFSYPAPVPQRNSYLPFDEWIYLKIYFTSMITEHMIMSHVHKIIKHLKSLPTFEKWFFIRYEDPEPHIRLRIKFKDISGVQACVEKINTLFTPAFEQGKITKIIYDSYMPEGNRYGSKNLPGIEKIFQIDSEAVLQYRLLAEKNILYKEIHWLFGLSTIQSYLTCYFGGQSSDDKIKFCLRVKDSFKNEYQISSNSFKEMNSFFKKNKVIFEEFLLKKEKYAEIHTILHSREKKIKKLLTEVELNEEVRFGLIHMSFNRLFPIAPRKNEAVCYDLFCRHILSKTL